MGHLTAYYHTAAQARQASGTISASVKKAGVGGSATASASSTIEETDGHNDFKTKFHTYGWNNEDKLPPQVCHS